MKKGLGFACKQVYHNSSVILTKVRTISNELVYLLNLWSPVTPLLVADLKAVVVADWTLEIPNSW